MDTCQPQSQCLAFVLVVAVFGLASPCHAARVIDSDMVYDETCPPENTQCGEPLVVIDGEAPPTVLEFVEPGWISLYDSISSEPAVWASDASVVDVSGGWINPGIGPGVQASDSATVRIVDGFIGGYREGVLAEDQSHVEVAGGTIVSAHTDALMLQDWATASIAGGTFTSEESYDVRT